MPLRWLFQLSASGKITIFADFLLRPGEINKPGDQRITIQLLGNKEGTLTVPYGKFEGNLHTAVLPDSSGETEIEYLLLDIEGGKLGVSIILNILQSLFSLM